MRYLLPTLPAPLPLMIVEGIEDLPTLHHFIQAWSTAAVIFERNYIRYVRSILSYYPWELQKMLYFILYLKTEGSMDIRSLTNYASRRRFMNENLPRDPSDVKASFSLSAAWSLLFTAHHIQESAHAYLETHLGRIASIKPSCPLHPTYYSSSCCPERPHNSRPHDPIHAGPPSWIEEQRILLSLWRLQLYADFSPLSTPSQSAYRALELNGFWAKLDSWQMEEINDVDKYVLENTDGFKGVWNFSKLRLDDHRPVAYPVPCPRGDIELHSRGQADTQLHQQSCGADYLETMLVGVEPQLYYCDPKPFWRLGFRFWDSRRMPLLKLLMNAYSKFDDHETYQGRKA